jgi:hypothetical protein
VCFLGHEIYYRGASCACYAAVLSPEEMPVRRACVCGARMEQTTLRTEWTRLTDGAIFVGARRRELFLCPLEVGLFEDDMLSSA